MSDVELNIGTDKSKIENSQIKVNVPDGEKWPSDHVYERIKELEREVREIRSFLAGSPLGEPGLTAKVNDALGKIKALEKEVDLLELLDRRLDKQEELLQKLDVLLMTYQPMLQEMQATYRTKLPVSIAVFYGTIIILFIATFLVVYLGRG